MTKIILKESQAKVLIKNILSEQGFTAGTLGDLIIGNDYRTKINNAKTLFKDVYRTYRNNSNVPKKYGIDTDYGRSLMSSALISSGYDSQNNPQRQRALALLSFINRSTYEGSDGKVYNFLDFFNSRYPNIINVNKIKSMGTPPPSQNTPSQNTPSQNAVNKIGDVTVTAPKQQYVRNEKFPIKPYQLSVTYIKPLQQMLGLPLQQQQGYFGPITLQKLKEKGVIIDPTIGIRDQNEYNNAVSTLTGRKFYDLPMTQMGSKSATVQQNKPNTQTLG